MLEKLDSGVRKDSSDRDIYKIGVLTTRKQRQAGKGHYLSGGIRLTLEDVPH